VSQNEMRFIARIGRMKHSIYIIIPKAIRRTLDLKPGDEVMITITKIAKKQQAESTAQIPENTTYQGEAL